jgi:type IV pilus assembly protein PilP
MKSRLLTPLALCLILAGCGDDGLDDLRAFMEATGKDGQGKIEPLPEVKKVDTFEYQQGDLLDPFMTRNLRATGKGGVQPDTDRPKQPLEEFPLDAMRMVGTLKKPGQSLRAVIKDPKGTLHTIQVGGRIGQNFGKVIAVSEEGLEIKELMQDAGGEWLESKAMMSMTEETSK